MTKLMKQLEYYYKINKEEYIMNEDELQFLIEYK